MPRDGSSRRRFLDVILGGGLVAWLGSIVYPVIRYVTPLRRAGPGGPTVLTREEVVKLEKQHFIIVPAGEQRVLVLEDPSRKLFAFDAKCTHEGCTVQYLPGQSVIWCACHNGRFDMSGRVLSGPPPRPLTSYVIERQEGGGITIFTARRTNA